MVYDGITTSERIPSQYIISITQGDKMLWNRAGSNLEPSTWEKQAKPSTPTADVRLIPRDDRDLGFDDGPDDAGTGQPDARGAMQVDDDNAAGDKPGRADQPPTRVRRVYTTPKNAEPHSRATALCAWWSTSAAKSPAPHAVTSHCQWMKVAKSNTKPTEEQRSWKSELAKNGMFGKINSSLLAALTGEQADMLRQQIGARGIASLEASVLKDAKDRHRRAKALGYEDVEDRYRHLTKSYLF